MFASFTTIQIMPLVAVVFVCLAIASDGLRNVASNVVGRKQSPVTSVKFRVLLHKINQSKAFFITRKRKGRHERLKSREAGFST